VFTKETLETIIRFAYEEDLFIFADEVYQENVHSEKCQFHSMKKVMMQMGEPFNKMQLASFMSTSKGRLMQLRLVNYFWGKARRWYLSIPQYVVI